MRPSAFDRWNLDSTEKTLGAAGYVARLYAVGPSADVAGGDEE